MSARARRGQPLAFLGVFLGGWIVLRGAMWESPFPLPTAVGDVAWAEENIVALGRTIARTARHAPRPVDAMRQTAAAMAERKPAPAAGPARVGQTSPAAIPLLPAAHQPVDVPMQSRAGSGRTQPSLPDAVRQASFYPSPVPAAVPEFATRSRVSGDAWLLYRPRGGTTRSAATLPAYGGSQAGAVVRYALAPATALGPQLHLRGTGSLRGRFDGEAAFGLSARLPIALPVRAYAEARVRERDGSASVRPAVLAASELPPIALPLGTEAEVYVQGGYVAGRDATPFFDGQAVVDRPLATVGPAQVRVGGGTWAGGQRGGQRLDLGPRASLRMTTPAGQARLTLDWRLRIAGHARPGSGLALTFSAGF